MNERSVRRQHDLERGRRQRRGCQTSADRRRHDDAAERPGQCQAERELGRLVNVCNRIAWGSVPAELRAPAPAEIAALLERLTPEDRERLTTEARNAAGQRDLIARMADAEAQCIALLEAEQSARAEEEALYEEWAEFEAIDAAGKMQRFEAWRAARR
jgi:hypothetical protein